MKITFILFLGIFILMLLMFMIYLIEKSFNCYLEKWNQFECGFMAMNPFRIPFSFQFFLIAILFLIFDIEIALILSFPMEMISMKNMLMIFFFLLILTFGLMYEWQKSKIDWSK